MQEAMLYPSVIGAIILLAVALFACRVFFRRKVVSHDDEAAEVPQEKAEDPSSLQGKNPYRQKELYERVIEYMEKRKPFLDSEFRMKTMVTELYTNKLYLSSAINDFTGFNFRQFLNRYRVSYAKELMIKSPGARMVEIAEQSGFHTVVTFNTAFKLFEGKTPTEWMRDYRKSPPEDATSGPTIEATPFQDSGTGAQTSIN